MTIVNYLEYPYGKGSAFGTNTKQQISEIKSQYQQLKERFQYKIYRYKDNIIYHVVVPSKNSSESSYDVIIEAETKTLNSQDVNIESIPVKANVFHREGILCDWLIQKYDKRVETEIASTRNRYGVIGLERSIYLSFLFLHDKTLTRKMAYTNLGEKITNLNKIANNVRTQNEILNKTRERIKSKTINDQINDDRRKLDEMSNKHELFSRSPRSTHPKETPTIKSVKEVKAINKIPTSHKTKRTKSTKTTKKK